MELTTDTKVRLVALAALVLLIGMAVAVPRAGAVPPHLLTLADYEQTSAAGRLRFAERFTHDLLGHTDAKRAHSLRDFLDAHVVQIRADTTDRRVLDARLEVTAWTAAATGARILGWPATQ